MVYVFTSRHVLIHILNQGCKKHFKTGQVISLVGMTLKECCIFSLVTPCSHIHFCIIIIIHISIQVYLGSVWRGREVATFSRSMVSTDADSPPGTTEIVHNF